MPVRQRWRPHSGRGQGWRASPRSRPEEHSRAHSDRPRDQRPRGGRWRREAASSRTGTRCLYLLCGVTATGRSVSQQAPHRCGAICSAATQGGIREVAHDSATAGAGTAGLSVDLGEEIIGHGDHHFCHTHSIPGYTGRCSEFRGLRKHASDLDPTPTGVNIVCVLLAALSPGRSPGKLRPDRGPSPPGRMHRCPPRTPPAAARHPPTAL